MSKNSAITLYFIYKFCFSQNLTNSTLESPVLGSKIAISNQKSRFFGKICPITQFLRKISPMIRAHYTVRFGTKTLYNAMYSIGPENTEEIDQIATEKSQAYITQRPNSEIILKKF